MARTRTCKKCGEVIFYINQVGEITELICDKCRTKQYIYGGKYITCDKTCASCYNDSFRVKVVDYGENEKITLECAECKGSPRIYYIDRENKSGDNTTKEILIIENKIDSIENNMSSLESRVYEIDYKSECADKDLDRLKKEINQLSNILKSIKENIKGLES